MPASEDSATTSYPAYYAQHVLELLNPSNTLLQELQQAAPSESEQKLRTVLGGFLFSGDDVRKPISVLSGGEKARAALAKLLLQPSNLLLMDELPTTSISSPVRFLLTLSTPTTAPSASSPTIALSYGKSPTRSSRLTRATPASTRATTTAISTASRPRPKGKRQTPQERAPKCTSTGPLITHHRCRPSDAQGATDSRRGAAAVPQP